MEPFSSRMRMESFANNWNQLFCAEIFFTFLLSVMILEWALLSFGRSQCNWWKNKHLYFNVRSSLTTQCHTEFLCPHKKFEGKTKKREEAIVKVPIERESSRGVFTVSQVTFSTNLIYRITRYQDSQKRCRMRQFPCRVRQNKIVHFGFYSVVGSFRALPVEVVLLIVSQLSPHQLVKLATLEKSWKRLVEVWKLFYSLNNKSFLFPLHNIYLFSSDRNISFCCCFSFLLIFIWL